LCVPESPSAREGQHGQFQVVEGGPGGYAPRIILFAFLDEEQLGLHGKEIPDDADFDGGPAHKPYF
jgi:hypothetical protein